MNARVIEYSAEQHAAIDAILAWLDDPDRDELALGGLAGTGKTTIVREVVQQCRRSAAVLAFTGKAAHVLRTKGVEDARTIHSTIYQVLDACRDCRMSPEACEARRTYISGLHAEAKESGEPPPRELPCPATGTTTRYRLVDFIPFDLIIVDEASMLSRRVADDLRSFGKKLLFVGDHGQLEPIGADAEIMDNPDVRLEAIHRQAAGSPVVQFAHALRRGIDPTRIQVVDPRADLLRLRRGLPSNAELAGGFDMILCGFNETRIAVNRRIRNLRGFHARTPQPGEPVICLRNKAKVGLFNGLLARVEEAERGRISVTTEDGREIEGLAYVDEQFGAPRTLVDEDRDLALFDYGYCITVHKSQGSEWPRVCVLEQLAPMWSAERWRYTAATRASHELTWCTSEGTR